MINKVTDTVIYVGANDHDIDLFEGQYRVPNGISYNSYAIIDEKIAIMDTVDAAFTHEWLDNIQNTLGSRTPDYLVVQHMELQGLEPSPLRLPAAPIYILRECVYLLF